MTDITEHNVNGTNNALKIEVVDQPGAGGANCRYDITGFDTDTNRSAIHPSGYKASFGRLTVIFQNGPPAEAGVNGVTNEALLAILAHRLQGFQTGPFPCATNAAALVHIRAALDVLKARSAERLARGIEGQHVA